VVLLVVLPTLVEDLLHCVLFCWWWWLTWPRNLNKTGKGQKFQEDILKGAFTLVQSLASSSEMFAAAKAADRLS